MGFNALVCNNNVSTCFLHLRPNTIISSSSNRVFTVLSSAKMHPPERQRGKTVEDLKERIQKQMASSSSPLISSMELIDSSQRLGIGYHFEQEINVLLERLVDLDLGHDLYATALRFRLLRHNGFPAHSDVFNKFIYEKNRKFKNWLTKDLLSLYEASYLASRHEVQLLQAMELTTTHLSLILNNNNFNKDPNHVMISQALEIPRHLRMARLESRNYIQEYSMDPSSNMDLLHFAKVDYNSVQSLHQHELAEIVRWWKQLELIEKLGFGRDRPLECYLWTVGIFPEPYNSTCRIQLTKTIAILLVIDDIFDTYGSFSDLVLFTNAIKRWDLNAMESLPAYMKICYMALYNTTNDIAYMVLKKHGWTVLPHLKRTWIDMFEAFLREAKWSENGYFPKLEEYVVNGATTAGTYMALVHSFFLLGKGVTNHTISMMNPYPELFSISGKILRLWDDLGTATEEKERGDVARNSIDCYTREKSSLSEEEGRKEVRQMIRKLWIELNGELKCPSLLHLPIVNASLNLARTSQVVYQHGDDRKGSSVDDQVQALMYQPLHIN